MTARPVLLPVGFRKRRTAPGVELAVDGRYNIRRIQCELDYRSPDGHETAWHAQQINQAEPANLTPTPTGGR